MGYVKRSRKFCQGAKANKAPLRWDRHQSILKRLKNNWLETIFPHLSCKYVSKTSPFLRLNSLKNIFKLLWIFSGKEVWNLIPTIFYLDMFLLSRFGRDKKNGVTVMTTIERSNRWNLPRILGFKCIFFFMNQNFGLNSSRNTIKASRGVFRWDF